MDFFFLPGVSVFTGVLAVIVLIGFLELIASALAGVGLGNLLDSALDTTGLPESAVLDWVFIRETPLMVTVVSALAGYATGGLAMQMASKAFFGELIWGPVAYVLAIIFGMTSVKLMGKTLKRFKVNHSTALLPHEFLGQKVHLLSMTASADNPGEAKFVDRHGQAHYVMIRPAKPGTEFKEGQPALLVEQDGAFYVAEPLKD